MTADQVLTAMVSTDHTFAVKLADYCQQENVLGILLMKANNHANTCLLVPMVSEELLNGKKKTRQPVQVVKLDDEDYMNTRRAFYSIDNWEQFYVQTEEKIRQEEAAVRRRSQVAQSACNHTHNAPVNASATAGPATVVITYNPAVTNVTISNAF